VYQFHPKQSKLEEEKQAKIVKLMYNPRRMSYDDETAFNSKGYSKLVRGSKPSN
jgi:hypothetical protein